MSAESIVQPGSDERRDALVERIVNAVAEAMDVASIYLGDRLGYYRALRDGGPMTSAALASAVETNERYTREWLEQQTVTGILHVQDSGDPATRRYVLPVGHDEVLTEDESLAYIAPFPRQ